MVNHRSGNVTTRRAYASLHPRSKSSASTLLNKDSQSPGSLPPRFALRSERHRWNRGLSAANMSDSDSATLRQHSHSPGMAGLTPTLGPYNVVRVESYAVVL